MKLKHSISDPSEISDKLPQALEALKKDPCGLQVPEGYFDTLSPHIVDKLGKPKGTFRHSLFTAIGKPSVWSPVLATVLVALTFIFIIPRNTISVTSRYDTLTELNNGYDASFAEDVILAESNTLEAEIETSPAFTANPVQFGGVNHLTDEEIASYLKDQEIETELLLTDN